MQQMIRLLSETAAISDWIICLCNNQLDFSEMAAISEMLILICDSDSQWIPAV